MRKEKGRTVQIKFWDIFQILHNGLKNVARFIDFVLYREGYLRTNIIVLRYFNF